MKPLKRSVISEPINIVTGSLGAAKTLWAIEQADLLRQHGDAKNVYQVGINEPDTRYLPNLPFPLEEWHIRADAGELENAVIIVDEFHKWMPQRSQSQKVPEFIEAMAEARRRDVRFLLVTQSSEFDHFLKGTRLNKHFYLSRKAGLRQSNILEWSNRFVARPEEDKDARAAAVKHLAWRHPIKKYGSWYVSAKAHRFRRRIPLRLWLVPPFLIAFAWFGYKMLTNVGGLISGDAIPTGTAQAATFEGPTTPRQTSPERLPLQLEPDAYLAQFQPVIGTMPWSAPAWQGRSVASDPQLFCATSAAGVNGVGEWQDAECRCFTEQMTPWDVEPQLCEVIARQGIYNPYRPPLNGSGAEPDGKADSLPRPAGPAGSGVVLSSKQVSGYGDFGGDSASAY